MEGVSFLKETKGSFYVIIGCKCHAFVLPLVLPVFPYMVCFL